MPSPPSPPRWPRVVLHVDMDAFYASIEARDNPQWRGLPLVVGGGGRRGVVAAASYEARRFGVHSAMPGYEARRRCPQAVFVAPRMAHYSAESRRLRAILDRWSPCVEPLSLDEAFLDMTGSEGLFGPPDQMASGLRAEIRETLQLSASVGVATVKFIAKIASDMHKPDGQTLCPPGGERAFLAPLPVERLWGVGPRTGARLHDLGLRSIGDVAACDPALLVRLLGEAQGRHLARLSRGEDPRPVVPDRERKSLGAERTLAEDLRTRAQMRLHLLPLLDEVARGLRREGWRAGGLTLKVKTSAFRLVTRSRLLERPAASAAELLPALDALLEGLDVAGPFRLVGVSAYRLSSAEQGGGQLSLAEGAQLALGADAQHSSPQAMPERHGKLASVMDAVQARFGAPLLSHASVHAARNELAGTQGVQQASKGDKAEGQSAQADSTSPEMQSQSSD